MARVEGKAGKKRKSAKGGVTRNYFRQESRKSSKTRTSEQSPQESDEGNCVGISGKVFQAQNRQCKVAEAG